MKWQNKVQLIGYLGTDPVIQEFPSGLYCASLRLATNSGFSRPGKVRVTTWHNVILWGRRSGYIKNCFLKGSHVLVDGRLAYRSYTDKSGQVRQVTEIKASRIMNLDR